jgi:hypothetical protein
MTMFCLYGIPHTYVYWSSLNLTAGQQYVWETRDLRSGIFQASPDPYMYLVRGNTIVAKNNDHIGKASLIAYVPTVSGAYYLIIRAYSKYSPGTCDVYQTTGAGEATRIANDVKFGGYPVDAHWKADERILTSNATGDTYLYIIHGNTMLRDDDSGSGFCSSIRPGFGGYGTVVVGSYSAWSEGTTSLCNYYQSYLANPGRRDEMDDPKIIISETMVKFQTELMKQKPSLEELSHQEREARVKKLRDGILSKKDISQLGAPEIQAPKEFVDASKRYDKLLKAAEKKLERLSYAERAAEMAKMEREKREIFRDLVPQEDE